MEYFGEWPGLVDISLRDTAALRGSVRGVLLDEEWAWRSAHWGEIRWRYWEVVHLRPGLNVVYGLNGSGKTRFLQRLEDCLAGGGGPEQGILLDPRSLARTLGWGGDAVDPDAPGWADSLADHIIEGLNGSWWMARAQDLHQRSEIADFAEMSFSGVTNVRVPIAEEGRALLVEFLQHGQFLFRESVGGLTDDRILIPVMLPGKRPPATEAAVRYLRSQLLESIPALDAIAARYPADEEADVWDDGEGLSAGEIVLEGFNDAVRDAEEVWYQACCDSPLVNSRNLTWNSLPWEVIGTTALRPLNVLKQVIEDRLEMASIGVDDQRLVMFGESIPLFLPPVAKVAGTNQSSTATAPLFRHLSEPTNHDDRPKRAVDITRAHLAKHRPSTDEAAREDSLSTEASKLSSQAAATYSALLPGSPPLQLEVGDPRGWLSGSSPSWSLGDSEKPWQDIPLDRGSSAQQRLAYLSIAFAADPQVPFILLDEPEAGLHRTAEAAVARRLSDGSLFGEAVIVAASHSPELLEQRHANLIHARFNQQLRPMTKDDFAIPEFLGLRRSDLLASTRVLLLVEGEHDRIVLNHMMEAGLAELGVQILALRGAAKAHATLDSQFLFDFTDATMVVLLDNLNAETLQSTWTRACSLAEDSQPAAARDVVVKEIPDKDGEGKFIRDFMTRALERRLHDRVDVYALTEPDIIYYLPHQPFTRKTPWPNVKQRYADYVAAAKSKKSKPMDLKSWISKTYSVDANSPELIAEACAQLDVPPAEFAALHTFLQKVARGRSLEALHRQDSQDSILGRDATD